MPVVMLQISKESNGVNCIFANKGDWGEIFGNLFIISSNSHFSKKKKNFEQYLFKPKPGPTYNSAEDNKLELTT